MPNSNKWSESRAFKAGSLALLLFAAAKQTLRKRERLQRVDVGNKTASLAHYCSLESQQPLAGGCCLSGSVAKKGSLTNFFCSLCCWPVCLQVKPDAERVAMVRKKEPER